MLVKKEKKNPEPLDGNPEQQNVLYVWRNEAAPNWLKFAFPATTSSLLPLLGPQNYARSLAMGPQQTRNQFHSFCPVFVKSLTFFKTPLEPYTCFQVYLATSLSLCTARLLKGISCPRCITRPPSLSILTSSPSHQSLLHSPAPQILSEWAQAPSSLFKILQCWALPAGRNLPVSSAHQPASHQSARFHTSCPSTLNHLYFLLRPELISGSLFRLSARNTPQGLLESSGVPSPRSLSLHNLFGPRISYSLL